MSEQNQGELSGESRAELGELSETAPLTAADSALAVETVLNAKGVEALIGQIIDGKYKVISKLGSGGMGAVFKAEHLLMGRTVALKVLHPHLVENEELLKRFQHEAKVASKLNHPNAVTTYDFGIFRGAPYIVMEFVPGKTLKELIAEEGRLAFDRVRDIFLQTCNALEQAHSLGIVHRDLKPDNIMLIQNPQGREQAIVLDFGIAKILNQQNDQRTILTQAGTFFGTPKYASPEQAMEKPLDGRSDIYTLGIIIYEALSGAAPFDAPSVMEILIKHINHNPLPLRSFKPELNIPTQLDELVMKCLKKKPEERFQDIEELSQALRNLNVGRKTSAPASARLSAKKSKPWQLIFALLFATSLLGVGLAWLIMPKAAPKPLMNSATVTTDSKQSVDQNSNSSSPQAQANTPSPGNTSGSDSSPSMFGLLAKEAVKAFKQDRKERQVEEETRQIAKILSTDRAGEIKDSDIGFTKASPPTPAKPEESAQSAKPEETKAQAEPSSAPSSTTIPSATSQPNSQTKTAKEQPAADIKSEITKLEGGKKEAKALYEEGRNFYRQKRYAEAAEKFELATAYRSDAIASFISLGNCYLRLNQNAKAQNAFQRAIQVEPGYGPAHYNLAAFFAQTEQPRKAINSLKRAIQLDPRAKRPLADDPDFQNIRHLPEFQALLR